MNDSNKKSPNKHIDHSDPDGQKALLCVTLAIIFLLSLVLPAFSHSNTEIRINVPSRKLQLISDGRLIGEFPVGVGQTKATMTPPGSYRVDKKVINPIWEHPYRSPGESRIGSGASNPLGTRWIGFHAENGGVFGIHGTNSPNSIGKFVSHGCVRMHNRDVEEIFDLVEVGTPVFVTYDRFKLSRSGDKLNLQIYPDPYSFKKTSAEEIAAKILEVSPYAQIDHEILAQAAKENSDAVYEVASLKAPIPQPTYAAQPYYYQPQALSGQTYYQQQQYNYGYNYAYPSYYQAPGSAVYQPQQAWKVPTGRYY